jgi:hypothetical protein
MTVCPVALAVGCKRCPVVNLCPLKGVLGNHVKEDPVQEAADTEEQAADEE